MLTKVPCWIVAKRLERDRRFPGIIRIASWRG